MKAKKKLKNTILLFNLTFFLILYPDHSHTPFLNVIDRFRTIIFMKIYLHSFLFIRVHLYSWNECLSLNSTFMQKKLILNENENKCTFLNLNEHEHIWLFHLAEHSDTSSDVQVERRRVNVDDYMDRISHLII